MGRTRQRANDKQAAPKRTREDADEDNGLGDIEVLLEMPVEEPIDQDELEALLLKEERELKAKAENLKATISGLKAQVAKEKAKRVRKGNKFNDEEKGKDEAEPSEKAPRKKPRPREKGSFLGMARDYEKVRKKTKTVDDDDDAKKAPKKRKNRDAKWLVSVK
jgi:hypothetical protein